MSKKAVITGVSGNIGFSLAKLFLESGFEVIGTYRSKNENLAKLIQKGLEPYLLDLEDLDGITTFANGIENNIDVLINNAGMNIPNDFDKIEISDWDQILSVNLRGVFYLSKQISKKINNKGSIINIGSFSGQVGGPRTTHYAVSKAGVISLTQNMARFFAPKEIRVNCVSPGVIESEMAAAAKNLPILKDILLSRLGRSEEVAEVVYFLSSEKASYITGQTINVNGGLYF